MVVVAPNIRQLRRPVATPKKTRPRRFALPDHGTDERTVEAIEAFLEGPEVRRQRPGGRRRPTRKGYPNTGSATAATGGPGAPSRNGTGSGVNEDGTGDQATSPGPTFPAVTTITTATSAGTRRASAAATTAAAARASSATTTAPAASAAEATAAEATAAATTAVVPAPDRRPHLPGVRPVTDIRTIPGRLEFAAALERESIRAARYARPASVAVVELVAERPTQGIDLWVRTLAGPVARTLRGDTRATDLVARVGNARFQVILPETPEAGAGRFAERLSNACQTSIDATGAPVAVRVTVATSTVDHSLQEALAHALHAIEAA